MYSTDGLITAFSRNGNYIHTHCDGLTHAQSLIQPPVPGNCINWILGHILAYRNLIHELLGEPPLSLAATARYDKDTPPVLADGPGVINLADLLALYDKSQAQVAAAIPRLTPARADEVVTQHGFTMRRADLLMSWMRHESYHAGNLEWLGAWARK